MFKGKNFSLELNKKTYIMGILNVTPDSFFDKGSYFSPSAAAEHAMKMQRDGADIIDIGAMSTRPGSEIISPEAEIERLRPVLSLIAKHLPLPISVDTIYPETARFALENGASIINDVSGEFKYDMAQAVKDFEAAWIITHAPGDSAGEDFEYKNGVAADVSAFFELMLEKTDSFGISKENICLDPGFGFSKNTAQNMELLRNLNKIKRDNSALLCGVSAKRFIGDITNQPKPENRLYGTLAANIAAVYAGADIVRVHNVKAHSDALKIIDTALYATCRGDY